MNINQILLTLLILIACCVGTFFLGRETKPTEYEQIYKVDTLRILDTFLIASEPLIIEKSKAKIVYKDRYFYDSVKISPHPFTAILDTIIKADTLNIEFEYPTALFSVLLRKQPDSVFTQKIYIDRQIFTKSEPEWWKTTIYAGGGLILGVLIGKGL